MSSTFFEPKRSSSGRWSCIRYGIVCIRCIIISSIVGRRVCVCARACVCMCVCVCVCVCVSIEHTILPTILLILMHLKHALPYLYVQDVPGGMCQTSEECSLS